MDILQNVDSVQKTIYLGALEAAGQTPNSYTDQLNVHLNPAMRSEEAAKVILRRLLATMQTNKFGIKAEIDTEFLHDYRIAKLRTCSALNQICGSFRHRMHCVWSARKLHSLLEFLESLITHKEMPRLIKQLKHLQDNRGEFTDLEVQQVYLLAVAQALDIDEVRDSQALTATGFLVETMARRQQEVKADFADTFAKFAS